jgi:hypothetical protein
MRRPIHDPLSDRVIAACTEVHRERGPGLLESVYEAALNAELRLRAIPFRQQVSLPVSYKGVNFNTSLIRHGLRRLTRTYTEISRASRLPSPVKFPPGRYE